jgi:hypothetical protein
MSTTDTKEADHLYSLMHIGEELRKIENGKQETPENEIKRTSHVLKAVQRFESKPMHSHCIPTKAMLDMDKAQQPYNEMYDDCRMEPLPLTKMTDLVITESCIPSVHKEMEAIIKTISHAIMRRLLCIISITNTGMLEILGPWSLVCNHETNMYIHETNTSRMGTGMESTDDSK